MTGLGEAFQQRVRYTRLLPPGSPALQGCPGGGLHAREAPAVACCQPHVRLALSWHSPRGGNVLVEPEEIGRIIRRLHRR